jgi:hypothetical protein
VDQSIKVSFIWGLENIEGKDATDSSSVGEVVYGEDFNMASPETQQAIYDFCVGLFTEPRFAMKIRPRGFDGSRCPMLNFKEEMESRGIGFPVNSSYFYQAWTQSYSMYEFLKDFGAKEGQIKWVRAEIITYQAKASSGVALKPEYEFWESVVEEYRKKNSLVKVAQPLIQSAPAWPRTILETAFIDGIGVSISTTVFIAWIAILLFTSNLYLSLFSSAVLMMTVISLVGGFVVMGWSLGALEVVSLSISIGLGVDYALHLGHVYAHAYYPDRIMRTRQAITEIGGSVIAGATTTLCSMLVLLGADVQIFVRMGGIIALTIVISLIYTLGLLMSILLLVGPEKNAGNYLKYIPERCFRGPFKRHEHLPPIQEPARFFYDPNAKLASTGGTTGGTGGYYSDEEQLEYHNDHEDLARAHDASRNSNSSHRSSHNGEGEIGGGRDRKYSVPGERPDRDDGDSKQWGGNDHEPGDGEGEGIEMGVMSTPSSPGAVNQTPVRSSRILNPGGASVGELASPSLVDVGEEE